MLHRRSLSIVVISTVLAVSAGCGGSESAEPAISQPPTSQPPTSDSATSDSAVSDSTPVTEPAPVATDAPASGSDFDSLRACMTGNWIMIAEEVEDLFSDTQLAAVPGLQVTVDGEGVLALAGDGTFSYTPGYTATISMLDTTGTGEWSGSAQGNWALDGNGLTMEPTSNDIAGSMTIFGNTSPLPSIAVFEGAGTVVDCNPATMEIQLDTPVGSVSHTLLAG